MGFDLEIYVTNYEQLHNVSNEFEINEAGTSKKVTGTQIATFVFSGNEITMPGTGSLTLPKGNDGARPGTPTAGMIRYNTTSGGFEGYTTAWGSIGGGASAGGVIYENSNSISSNYTLSTAKNGFSVGPQGEPGIQKKRKVASFISFMTRQGKK